LRGTGELSSSVQPPVESNGHTAESNPDTERVNSSVIERDFQNWLGDLETRHLGEMTFREVARALRALSSTYVERRQRLGDGGALSGAGKRAAFALFYAPLHFLLVQHAVASLASSEGEASRIVVDLGCGTGAAGAAWATVFRSTVRAIGVDRHPWALGEAAKTYRTFGLGAQTRQGDIAAVALPKPPATFIAAFTMNELADEARDRLFGRLLDRARRGDAVLIVEPLAGFVAPWWATWRAAFEAAGGRADEWRLRTELPPIVAKLDRAAGLNHREITGRTLWIAPSARSA
jgi:SAM-dependent methyltransferase